jgi:hypothetical protein
MLRLAIYGVLCAVWLAASALSASGETWSFEGDKIGVVPDGWEATRTGEGPGSVWQVVADGSAPDGTRALAQMSSEGPRRMFNLCVAKDTSYSNPDVSVSLKAVSGVVDQGGGPVWRYVDANNYYVARLNPLETNFRIYKVEGGKRTELQSADVDEPAGRAAHRASRQSHPRLPQRQAVARCDGQHVPGCRPRRPVDQGRRSHLLRQPARGGAAVAASTDLPVFSGWSTWPAGSR